MGTDISHIVKHDFKKFHDRNASKTYCESILSHLRKELLLGDGDPEWDEMKILDEEDDFLRMKLADYDVTLHLLPDLWEIESYDRFSHIVMGDRVRKNAFDVVRALGAKEVWHASDYFGWLGGLSYPGCDFEEWMEYLGQEYGKPIQELSPADFWKLGPDGYLDYEPIYHDNFKECFDEFERLQESIPDYRLLGISRVGDHFLRCEKNGELYLIDERWKTPFIDAPVHTYWTFDGHFVVIKDGKSALYDSRGVKLTPFVKGLFEKESTRKPVQRGGIKMYHEQTIVKNVEARLSLIIFERFDY
ncbi:MAG: hypothetical protein IKN98_07975 [Bacteroidales bacterium]|nr:hypothetical protein [Bacteroidales bacterium]